MCYQYVKRRVNGRDKERPMVDIDKNTLPYLLLPLFFLSILSCEIIEGHLEIHGDR